MNIISFQTAKLAKEKGFNYGTKAVYIQYLNEVIINDDPTHPDSHKEGEVKVDYNFYTENNTESDLSGEHYVIYEAPSQSLIQKWLREEFNCIVEVRYHSPQNGKHINSKEDILWLYEVDYYGKNFEITCSEDSDLYSDNFTSYEEALEKGLIDAIKLLDKN